MSNGYLVLVTAQMEPKNRASLLDALASIADGDCDFNGENGLDYMHPDVWNANGYKGYKDFIENNKDNRKLDYESNLDFYLEYVAKIKNDKECISTFINKWMDTGRNYYQEYEIKYIYNAADDIIAIAVAFIAGT